MIICPHLTNNRVPCKQHEEDPWECPDVILIYDKERGIYGLPIKDGGRSYIGLGFCPFCGHKLVDEVSKDYVGHRLLIMDTDEIEYP